MNYLAKSVFTFLIALTLLSVLNAPCAAQLEVAPIAQFMSDDNQTTRMVVRNTADQPVELNMELLYGYPASDEKGKSYVKLLEEVPESEPSAVSWIRIYPRHTVLPPDEQQTIRFAARPPAGLPEGEYWARPAISARKLDRKSASLQSGQGYQADINLIQRTILSLNYRHGSVKTGVTIQNAEITQDNDTLSVIPHLKRDGNAAFLGHLNIRLTNTSGRQIKQYRKEVAVYHELNPEIDFDIEGLSRSTYRVQISLDTRDRKNENDHILQASPTEHTTTIRIK